MPLNLAHLSKRAQQSGHIDCDLLSKKQIADLLAQRIDQIDLDSAKEDVVRFLKSPQEISIWSNPYFHQLAEKAVENAVNAA